MDSNTYSKQIKNYLTSQFNLPEEQIDAMLPDFKKTLSSHLRQLHEAQSSGSLQQLEKAAHTIKGALWNLGLTECAEIAVKLEQFAADDDKSIDYPTLVDTISTIVNEIVNEEND